MSAHEPDHVGRILAQWPVPVLAGDTPETLAARVLRVEHRLLPLTLEALLGARAPLPAADSLAFALRAADTAHPDDMAARLPGGESSVVSRQSTED